MKEVVALVNSDRTNHSKVTIFWVVPSGDEWKNAHVHILDYVNLR